MADLIIPEINIEKNTSGTKLQGRTLNFIEGAGTTLTLGTGAQNRINLTVASTGGSDTFTTVEVDGVAQSTNAPTLDFDSTDFTLTESPTDDFDITINDGGISHNNLADLTNQDDHSQYLFLAGRVGAHQDVYGSTTSGKKLRLWGNNVDNVGRLNSSVSVKTSLWIAQGTFDYDTQYRGLEISPNINNINDSSMDLRGINVDIDAVYDTAFVGGSVCYGMKSLLGLDSEAGMASGTDTGDITSIFGITSPDLTNGPRTLGSATGIKGQIFPINTSNITLGIGVLGSAHGLGAGVTYGTVVGVKGDVTGVALGASATDAVSVDAVANDVGSGTSYAYRQTGTIGDGNAFEHKLLVGSLTPQTEMLHVVGTGKFTSDVEIDGALNHDGTTVGFYGTTPAVQSAAYSVTNVTTDRDYNANSVKVHELADVVGTLIADLQLLGLIG